MHYLAPDRCNQATSGPLCSDSLYAKSNKRLVQTKQGICFKSTNESNRFSQ